MRVIVDEQAVCVLARTLRAHMPKRTDTPSYKATRTRE